MSGEDMERLRQLADAYGVQSGSLGPVADAIIARTPLITWGANDRGSVLAVVSLIVRDEGTLEALRSRQRIPDQLVAEMERAVGQHEPAIPARELVNLVLNDVRELASAAA